MGSCTKHIMSSELCPPSSSFFGFMGVASALVFSNLGAAYGTAKSGVGLCSMGVLKPDLVMKSIIPCVMAGILGIYGLIVAVILTTGIKTSMPSSQGYAQLAAGLCCGIIGDAGVRANAQQQKLFAVMVLMLIFAEALGLYGLIVGIVLSSKSHGGCN